MDGEYPFPEQGLLAGQGLVETIPDGLSLLAGAGGAGALGLLRPNAGREAGHLFRQGLAVNQMLYADFCRGPTREAVNQRPPNRMLRAVMGLALGSALVPFLFLGPGTFAARVLDLAALGLGGLLSRAFLDRPDVKKTDSLIIDELAKSRHCERSEAIPRCN
jgi:hypothetical protein